MLGVCCSTGGSKTFVFNLTTDAVFPGALYIGSNYKSGSFDSNSKKYNQSV